jgi:hypothetical protein
MARDRESSVENHNSHERVRELCALYGSGTLNKEELKQLDQHLPHCSECTELLQEYSRIVRYGMPVLAEQRGLSEVTGFDAELGEGKQRLLAKLQGSVWEGLVPIKHGPDRSQQADAPMRVNTALTYALALLMAICTGIGGYVVGTSKLRDSSRLGSEKKQHEPHSGSPPMLTTTATQTERERTIEALSLEIRRLLNETSIIKRQAEDSERARSQEAATMAKLIDENAGLRTDREPLARRFEDSQARLGQLSKEMDQLRSERDGTLLHNGDLDNKLEAFKTQVRTLEETISEQQRLLSADRDIRELMGARDLLLADVFDVDQNGRNKRAFGRIFYTKNKSLIFYAFDLDRQPGLRNTGSFQVWGAKAADNGKGSAFNMGIFYMDNEAMRRWVLKCDNSKILAQIDSVFVTVEPEGGSDKPRGKQLLFASLRGEPNHP